MTVEKTLRLMAGTFVIISAALAHWHSPHWLWFTAFVGLNLFQSGITDWCPMMTILEKAGMPRIKAGRGS
jgi:DUF2892 family protein